MGEILRKGKDYDMDSSNIQGLRLDEQECYTDGKTRVVLIISFKRGPKYRYWPANFEDLQRGCKANEGHALSTWFQDFKDRDYEKIIE